MEKDSPCHGCEKRHAEHGYNCHSDCPEYKAYHEEREAKCELIRKKRLQEADAKGVRLRSIRKSRKAKEVQKCYWKG